MSYLALTVTTALLAVLLWKIFRWMTKRKSIENPPHRDSEWTESTGISSKSTEQEKQKYARLSASAAPNSEAKVTEIQKELHQEIRRRENADDWAEFLTLELEAHIQAYVKTEQQYKRLFMKLDPASQEILKENKNEALIRTFKNVNEAQIAWAESQNNKDKSWSENKRKFSHDELDKEAEFNEIVETNLQFLQATNHHQASKTASKKRNSRLQRRHCGQNSPRLNDMTEVSNPVNIVIEECMSPEKLTSQEDEEEQTEDNCKLGLQNLIG